MSDFAEFEIDVAPNGTGPLRINGEDVSDRITGFTLQVAVGQPPVLSVFERSSGSIVGSGIVQVTQKPNASQVYQFLDSIDIDELEIRSLAEAGWGESPTVAMIRILKEWVDGRS